MSIFKKIVSSVHESIPITTLKPYDIDEYVSLRYNGYPLLHASNTRLLIFRVNHFEITPCHNMSLGDPHFMEKLVSEIKQCIVYLDIRSILNRDNIIIYTRSLIPFYNIGDDTLDMIEPYFASCVVDDPLRSYYC